MRELSGYVFSALRGGEFPLYRGSGDGFDPILLVAPIREYSARESLKRLEHEHDLKAELDVDWAVRPVALSRYDGRMALVLEDPGGELLDQVLGQPIDVTQFLRIAIPLAAALRGVHERNLIHKDIKPANILVDVASGSVRLTGFGIASRLPRERQAPAPPEIIAGTLAYMAPEQTGRINRSIDARSDLYSLGVTFYEMLTGTLPFTAADPMEWVHCHIARQAVPPCERVAAIPGPISVIVMKLLGKTAEDRYQTAAGVEADLRRCLAEWEGHGRIDPFPPGAYDLSDRLLIPEKLYGREREIETLLASFDRVVANGTLEFVLVSGYSGIGKSSAVNELHKALVPPRGLFAEGKFDQYKRDIPYATLAQAFQSLIRPLLGKSDAELAGWRDALSEALGLNGRLMTDVVPELTLLIGEQPAVVELPPQQAQSRLQLVFRRFLGVFARPEHPLTLFLDDLQWVDAATLDLLAHLVTHSDVRYLLLVGAYRNNEISPSHPLLLTRDAIRKAGAQVQEIVLAPLGLDDIGQLVADALHSEPEDVRPLAKLVQEKTGGNPFFAIQFFAALAEEGLLACDPVTQAWHWDVDCIRAKSYTDNVVDLMTGKLKRFSAATQEALKQLACLGNVAEISTLALVYGKTEKAIHATLWEAVRAGLVVRRESTFRFLHDRIQQAAYSLIPEASRANLHLRIGRVLLASTTADRFAEHLFEIVNQLNRGTDLIHSPDERERVAELNLAAGKRAKASAAYSSALTYLAAGRALLTAAAWGRTYRLAFDLEFNQAECQILTGALAAAEEQLAMLSRRSENFADKAAVACLRADLYTNLDRPERAIEIGFECLRFIGITWAMHPTDDEVNEEYARIWQQLGKRSVEDLLKLPSMTDANSCAAVDVLTSLQAPAHWIDRNLVSLIIGRMANLTLAHGNTDGSCFAYVYLGMVLENRFGDYRRGLRFGKLGINLLEKNGLDRFKARVYNNFAMAINPWANHVRSSIDLLRLANHTAREAGDITFAGYSCTNLISARLIAGDPLSDVHEETETALASMKQARFGTAVDIVLGQLGLVRALRGVTSNISTFNHGEFIESQFEQHLEADPRLVMPACWYWIRKIQACYLAAAHKSAVGAAIRAEELLWTSPGFIVIADYHFYAALARLALCGSASTDERDSIVRMIETHRQALTVWAENCPENFENRAALVEAEMARIEGRELDAERLYEQAIRSARANGFIHNEALANELASGFYAARGFEKVARVYLQDARYGYLRWGADGKVRQLEQLHPHLRNAQVPASPTTTIGAPLEQLDVGTVVKASQAVSGEIVLSRLIETLMTIALEHAGAERALLILLRGDEPRIAAEATTGRGQVEVTVREAAVTPSALPQSALHYVIRSRERVVLDDASVRNAYQGDTYIRERQPRSVMCLPVINQTKLVGALYLENKLTPYAFTSSRVAVLELLASQAAISLENARLYSELRRSEAYLAEAQRLSRTGSFGWSVATGEIIWSDETFRIFGYDKAPSATVDMVVQRTHPDDRPAVQQTIDRAAVDGKDFDHEYRLLLPDGSVRHVHAVSHSVQDASGNIEFVGAVTDVTTTKRAEEALRGSEQRFRDYAEIASDWLWETGPDHRLVHLSEQFAAAGISPALRIGLRRADFATDVDEEPEKWRLHIATLEARQPFRGFVYRVAADDGSARYIAASGKPVFDAEGRFLGYRGVGSDVTAAVRAEQAEDALHRTQMELAHVTRVTTLGQLAASIAHEVNQPLSGIITNASTCLRMLAADPPKIDIAEETARRTIRDGNRAADVIARLRVLFTKRTATVEPVDLNDAVREVLALSSSDLQRGRVVLRTELADELPLVSGDRIQLQQVVMNLLRNATDAMSGVDDRPRRLVIRTESDEEAGIRLSVLDVGVGFDHLCAERVFEAFYTTKSDGMGIGLSVSRSIIEMHSGRLWASSNDGPGATFSFTIPEYFGEETSLHKRGVIQTGIAILPHSGV